VTCKIEHITRTLYIVCIERTSTLWGIKIAPFLLVQCKIMPYCDDFWHIRVDAHENILSPACLTVFVKLKTENQLIRFVIAYLVADNNVKCETVAAKRDRRLHYSRPMTS